jgi:hypothetical protein
MYKQTAPAKNCFASDPSGGIVMIKPDSSDFTEYSGNNIKEYNFTGLFENEEEKEERFKELKEIGKGNKLIEKIIEINIEAKKHRITRLSNKCFPGTRTLYIACLLLPIYYI